MESATEINVLDEWIKEANSFLLEISQIILDYRESLQKHDNENLKTNNVSNDKYKLKRDYYNYFNIEEEKIDKIIFYIWYLIYLVFLDFFLYKIT